MNSMISLRKQLKDRIDHKTKPVGSLGRLEEIALQVGMILKTTRPELQNPHLLVFAADHGIAANGLVNPYPQSVTTQMVFNFLQGGGAVNVFCRQNKIALKVIDAGVNYDFGVLDHPDFIDAKIEKGTRNYLCGDAMSPESVDLSIREGKRIVADLSKKGCNCIGLGEMGIGNTSSASLIMSAILKCPLEQCIGRGTGTDDQQLKIKIRTLEEAYSFHRLQNYSNQPKELLSKVGGFEIAMMTGAYLQAAKENMVIVVDGFISTAALLVAHELDPQITDNCIFAHTSGEKGHMQMLAYLKARPLLNLGLRLGEGTGAALAIPLIQSAVNFLNEMASFESAGVSNKTS
jgi:nicotinate-nucleotide--dimethylbenzimidazole phosphoribosyltransferase